MQNLLQPRVMRTCAAKALRPATMGSKARERSRVSRSSCTALRAALRRVRLPARAVRSAAVAASERRAASIKAGNLSSSPGPHIMSSCGNRCSKDRPSRSAMQPNTPNRIFSPANLRSLTMPRREYTLLSACSRTEQVLNSTTWAASGLSVNV